ncbi:RUN domain-containing protein 2A [Tupaia chinensis]|uniref:RUN domain-containing protein 2A n=1 Tax=Tupaia chinensis TaxID=246437 RepID=L9KXX1_TUPCH|nr:RUN domain-containing protein 2A [Tupaia chinensis]
MAQQCFQNEYFDSLLHACKPCHLRCFHTPPPTCQRYCNAGSIFLDVANADLDNSRTDKILLPSGLGYTVEECTCEDCVKPKVDFDHFFPLPAMEEGATILVTTKTNDYCNCMPGSQNSDKRQFLLERLLDAVKQETQASSGIVFIIILMVERGVKICALLSDIVFSIERFLLSCALLLLTFKAFICQEGPKPCLHLEQEDMEGGLMSHWFSRRVTCLCAQFEAVLQHGLKRSRGLALTAAAIKQAAGFSSKTDTEPVFWYYVKEVLNKHELQRFCSLRHITSDVGRGRAWLRCALNEHSLERYLHMLLADRSRLSTFYEDWSFVMDEERSSMLPTMAAGLNSILFAINIDNKDLNGQSKFAPTVSDLLKESTQNVTSLLKESTQGVSSLLREITASSAVSILIKPEQETDPLPVVSRIVCADEQNSGDAFKKLPGTGESSEENSDRSSVNIMSAFESPFGPNSNGSQSSNSWKIDSLSLNGEFGYQKLDVKSIDDEDVDENEDDMYGSSSGRKRVGPSESPEK